MHISSLCVWFKIITYIFIIHFVRLSANFVHVCKRTDPQLDKCLVQTIESLRPGMVEGKFNDLENKLLKDIYM